MMKLVSSPASPFVRKVRVLIHETGQGDTIEEIPVATTALNPAAEAVAANPLARIPALIRDDGPAIYDSRVICRFLDARVNAGFYPESRLWDVLTLEATADGLMDSAVLISYEMRLRPEDKQFADWIDAQWGKVASAAKVINDRWMSHLRGPLDMSHIAVACGLAYLDFRHDARNWRAGNDALAEWFAEFAQRDSMIATAPEG